MKGVNEAWLPAERLGLRAPSNAVPEVIVRLLIVPVNGK